MSTTVTPKPSSQLWGIYHTDREHARELGDPLRTTIEAPTKIAAEEAAAKLGFGDPWAHPIAPDEGNSVREAVAVQTQNSAKGRTGVVSCGKIPPGRR
jgi:hypothetical protein